MVATKVYISKHLVALFFLNGLKQKKVYFNFYFNIVFVVIYKKKFILG